MEEIIIKECTNHKLSRAESLQLEMWLKESAKNRKIYAQMKLALLYPGSAKREELQEEVWANINDKITSHTNASGRTTIFGFWSKVAAILIFCFSLALVLHQFNSSVNDVKPKTVEVRIIEKVSLPGQKVTTMLPDGTIVKLNSDSKILVPDNFQDDRREITLQGEAFFEVARDESKPFIINTDNLRIKVLGTSFNVKSYPGEELAVVAVASGKVAVLDANDSGENLEQGEKIAYTSKTNTMVKAEYNWEEEFGWKENILLFQNNDLFEIMEILKRWYGVEFNINNSTIKLNKKFSGRYRDPSLKAVLEGISFVYNFSYTLKGKTVTINLN